MEQSRLTVVILLVYIGAIRQKQLHGLGTPAG
jgi:hypothetical protein